VDDITTDIITYVQYH